MATAQRRVPWQSASRSVRAAGAAEAAEVDLKRVVGLVRDLVMGRSYGFSWDLVRSRVRDACSARPAADDYSLESPVPDAIV